MVSSNSDTAIESATSGEGEAGAVAGKRRARLASRRRVLGRAARVAAAGIGVSALAAQESGRRALAASGVGPYDNYGVFSSSVSSSPAVSASGSNGANAVVASADSGIGVYGSSSSQKGVYGISSSGTGVFGDSYTGAGVNAVSSSGTGLSAQSNTGVGIFAMSGGSDAVVARAMGTTGAAVHGCAPGTPAPSSGVTAAVFAEGGSHLGLYATSDTGNAVQGLSNSGTAIYGVNASANSYAIRADNPAGPAILGNATNAGTGSGTGVLGVSDSGTGLIGESSSGSGITGVSKSDTGVVGESTSGYGVDAFSASGTALHAKSAASNGVALFAEGLLRIAGAAVGQATIPQNLTSVTVSTAAVTASSHILLTPLGNPRGALWISNIVPGTSFQINVGVDVFFPAGLVVQYLIIN